jgi:probable F420-dependent oxidoreductase
MDIGVMLPVEGDLAGRQLILDAARQAEDLGFHSVWVSDRMLKPTQPVSGYPYSAQRGEIAFRADRNWLDPIAVMGMVTAVTSRVQIGTNVLVLPYRNPIVLAQEAASLDFLSDGRLLLGVGVGWMREEFDALGVPMSERGRRTDEYIRQLRDLWSNPEGVTTRGAFFNIEGLALASRPARKSGPPILIGGNSPAALDRTARLGDGWAGVDLSPEEMTEVTARIHELTASYGRDPRNQLITLKLRMPPPRHHGEPAGADAAGLITLLTAYRQAGVDAIVYDLMVLPDPLAAITWLGREVRPAVAESSAAH